MSQPTKIVLGGCLHWIGRGGGGQGSYGVLFRLKPGKYFSSIKFGSKEAALRAAEHYWRTMSAELGLTKIVPIPMIQLGVPIPDAVIQYAGGFMDGDGSIGIYTSPGGRRARATINFTQSSASGEPEVFRFLRFFYGGNIYVVDRSVHNSAHRAGYTMHLPSDCIEPFARQVLSRCVIKPPQLQLLLDYLAGSVCETVAVEQSKRLHAEYGDQVDLARDRITPAYTAGIFDAEGCVMLREGCLQVCITQKCPDFLRAVQSVHGGSVRSDASEIRFFGPTAVSLLRAVEPHLHVKKAQVQLALAYVDQYPPKKGTKRSVEQMEDCGVATASIKQLKRC